MEELKTRANDVEIAYRVAGQGRPVLFIHGNTGSKRWFEKVMHIEGARTIAPDMPNFGDSSRIDSADIDVYADYVAEFIRNIDVTSPLPVVGHSLGGAVVISLAIRNPDLVSRLMLVDSAPLDGLKTPEEYYPVIEQYQSNRDLLLQALRSVTPTLDDESFRETLTDDAMRMNPIAFTGNARALERFDYTGQAATFEKPVMVVSGAKDVLITAEMAEATANAFPNGSLTILETVGHSVMVEAPETFISLVEDFLDPSLGG
ncbi:MAG: alpha/beta fold hydrolase [Spirochaetales bacterium]